MYAPYNNHLPLWTWRFKDIKIKVQRLETDKNIRPDLVEFYQAGYTLEDYNNYRRRLVLEHS